MTHDPPERPRERAINLPPLVLWSVAVLLAIHGVREFLSDATDVSILLDFAFIPAPWSVAAGFAGLDQVVAEAVKEAGDQDLAESRRLFASYVALHGASYPWSWLSYAVLHGSWLHVGLNSVWLAAFAPPVVRRAGNGRAVLLALVTATGGCLAQWLASPLSVTPMIGASAVVSGFMAAAATFIFGRPPPALPFGRPAPAAPRFDFLRNRQALLFLGSWFAVNILFGLLAQPLGITSGAIAWEAHIGGLAAGLLLFPLLDPWRRAPAVPRPAG